MTGSISKTFGVIIIIYGHFDRFWEKSSFEIHQPSCIPVTSLYVENARPPTNWIASG